ncbi:hypothetical protein MYCTH_2069839 [Thermothelomyces thermophilus ATCC 42464]|uniref:HD domain-containing protein n=1 Tax=Thermothelomyces thermophilus (strain ATCC 42464 / BCRC 31852 / DSM 1799) TaxID=573729 RepID=G2QLS8_THET4|nr:uncharacterized protein MYCTH_2069839 [Thermothelomyces thermophilus ATCC 42464]AEO60908.1 hypothetical protein MYCTH_2069839 [Thermothelomyces thermophilus ATCC 42464]
MTSNIDDPIAEHGWTPVPLDADAIFQGKPYLHEPAPVLVKDIHFPSDDPLVARAQEYAKEQLPLQTYNHSMRVFYWATAILHQQFPSHAKALSPSTLALACLLHDIGTAPAFWTSTRLSFEFHGAITAINLLSSPPPSSTTSQAAEAVCEAIIRHQDLALGSVGVRAGTITLLGQVLQLATVYDNVGARAYAVHAATRDDVHRAFPRGGWEACFAGIVRREIAAKPWAHSTHLGGPDGELIANAVEGNLLMKAYE